MSNARALTLGLLFLGGCAGAPTADERAAERPDQGYFAYTAPGTGPTPELAERFGGLALDCVHREYPNLVHHVLESDADVKPPRELTPAFHGCFDWHSAVHGHWLLARLTRLDPGSARSQRVRAALEHSLTAEKIAGEVEYLRSRPAFERPYGLAWLLQLAAELHGWDDPDARRWSATLQPLTELAVAHFSGWIAKLGHPIHSGEHSQTAFAMGLALDYAREVGDHEFESLLERRALEFHGQAQRCPLAREPSGHDFLSPCLAEADLMRRVLSPEAFREWLGSALPQIPDDGSGDWLPVAHATDRSDGKLAHLDGLNLSRAWMLDGIVQALADDARARSCHRAMEAHRAAGLTAVTGEHYAGGHWLGSFAVYLVTGRGIAVH